MGLEAVAVAASGLFSGVALYVALIARGAWLRSVRSNASLALADFRYAFPRVMALQAAFVFVGTSASIAWWLRTGMTPFLVAGVLLGAVAPFTLLFVTPVYRRLLDPRTEGKPIEAERQLRRWALLHLARLILGLGSFGVLVRALVAR